MRGGSICNENASITPFTNKLGLFFTCQTKDQSLNGALTLFFIFLIYFVTGF